MKRIFYLFIALSLSIPVAGFSQLSFMHSLGSSYSISNVVSFPGITYSPRLNLQQLTDEFNISVGTHTTGGFSFGGGGGYYMLDFPFMFEVNAGHASSELSTKNFGGFFGGGYGYNVVGATGGGSIKSAGPVINGGFRLFMGGRSYTLRLSYLYNFKRDGVNVFGIGILNNFGDV